MCRRRALYLVRFIVRESGAQTPSGQIRQTDRQHGLYSTLCCLKKKHTAQERESPQEKVHSDALEESTEEERIKPKQDFKTKTDQTKETAFFSG